jgi:hypothetical protein
VDSILVTFKILNLNILLIIIFAFNKQVWTCVIKPVSLNFVPWNSFDSFTCLKSKQNPYRRIKKNKSLVVHYLSLSWQTYVNEALKLRYYQYQHEWYFGSWRYHKKVSKIYAMPINDFCTRLTVLWMVFLQSFSCLLDILQIFSYIKGLLFIFFIILKVSKHSLTV